MARRRLFMCLVVTVRFLALVWCIMWWETMNNQMTTLKDRIPAESRSSCSTLQAYTTTFMLVISTLTIVYGGWLRCGWHWYDRDNVFPILLMTCLAVLETVYAAFAAPCVMAYYRDLPETFIVYTVAITSIVLTLLPIPDLCFEHSLLCCERYPRLHHYDHSHRRVYPLSSLETILSRSSLPRDHISIPVRTRRMAFSVTVMSRSFRHVTQATPASYATHATQATHPTQTQTHVPSPTIPFVTLARPDSPLDSSNHPSMNPPTPLAPTHTIRP